MRRLIATALAVAACGPPSRNEPLPLPRVLPTLPACVLARGSRQRPDTLRVVVPHPVDPARAPAWRDETERFVFAQLYEPLVRQDCAGALQPGLADTWAPLGDSAWRFRIRAGARFGDGTAVTSGLVAAALRTAGFPWRVSEAGERDVVVHGRDDRRLPTALAAGRWAIARPGEAGGWPVGTRGRVTPAGVGVGVTLDLGGRVLAFSWPAGQDRRDALDGGADGVLTDDPTAIEYAAGRAAFEALPLPWSRTYVAVSPPAQRAAIAAAGPWREAVRLDARAATGPYWWSSTQCGAAPAAGATAAARVVYPAGDPAAQGLAERLVARGLGAAIAVPPVELAAVVAAGGDVSIVPVPRSVSDPCRALAELGLAGRDTAALHPLLDARLHLVVRAGSFGVVLDGNGTPRIDP